MKTISNCTPSALRNSAKSILAGNLVAFPTETVYGLGADATNESAVTRIYEAKGRPKNHPLIVHISSIEMLNKWAADVPEYAMQLAKTFWPGPMTLILRRTSLAKDFITGGQDNVGIRVPSHIIALSLLKEFETLGGTGIAAPSANRFGKISPTCADDVHDELKDHLKSEDSILNGGSTSIGLESTIINCTESYPTILRPGAITSGMVADLLRIRNKVGTSGHKDKIKTPGLMSSHYSPNAEVYLTGTPKAGDGFIALEAIPTPLGVTRLASPINSEDFARKLYQSLRAADRLKLARVFVIPPNNDGISEAIRDRLIKAASM